MNLENRRQCENTRAKLVMMEELYERTRQQSGMDAHVKELTLFSLKKRMNQFQEEIARFESRVGTTTN